MLNEKIEYRYGMGKEHICCLSLTRLSTMMPCLHLSKPVQWNIQIGSYVSLILNEA